MNARQLTFPFSQLVRFLLLVAIIGPFQVAVAQRTPTADKLAKAKKYHSILAKRPSPGYLFDRFYDAWLDQDTVEGLQAFLKQQVDKGQAGGNSANRLLLAFFHAKQGNDPLALEEFRLALKDDPGNAALWYEKAVVEARTLDYDTALADLAKASESKVDSKLAPKIAKLQGKLLVRSQQIDKAIATWRDLLKKNPRDEDLYEDIIDLQMNEGLYDQAAQLSEAFVKKTRDPYKKVIRGIRTGDIYQRGGKSEKALETYTGNLAKLGSDSWIEKEVLAQIEQIFRREDDLVGLQKQFDKMLESYPKRISIRKRYADLLADLGDKDKAVEQFQQILELTPGDRANREEYIALLGRLEKLPEATKQLQALIKQNADDPELRIQLANLLDSQDKKTEAGAAIDQFLAVGEKSEYAYLRAARLLTRFELLDKASAVYDSLVKAFPESVAAKEALAAFLYDKREKKPDAIDIWKQIASGQDRSQLVRVARILSGRREHQAAFDLLKEREEEFKSDPIYLGQLITSAVALKKFEEAIPWASRRVQAAKSLADLEAAIVQGAEVVSKAEKGPEIIAKMSKNQKPSTQQSCLLAELLEREGDSNRADAVLAKAEGANAAGRKLFVVSQQIRLLNQRREWAKAAEATKKLIGLPGGRKSIHVRRLVELYQRDLKFNEALTWTQQWKKLSPGSTLPWLTESRLLTIQGKSEEALNVLRAAVQQFDADMDLRARLAAAYTSANKTPDARRIYWRLYEDTKDVGSKLRWAQELSRLAQTAGSVDRLIGQFEERRTNNRQSIVPLLALAEVHREAGDYEKRRDALLEATRVKPNDVDLLYHVARIEEMEGDWERALKTLEKADKIDKTSRSKEKMARLELRYGDPDKGYAILFELAGREKSDWQDVEAIADAMIGQQDWERAAKFLEPQLARFPKNYRLAYMHASAVEEFGNLDEAADLFVDLLDNTDEIPNRKASFGNNRSFGVPSSYLQQFQGIAPPGTAEYMSMMYQTNSVYMHRQGRRGGMTQASLMMPPNVDSLRSFVLAHLIEIGRMGMDDAQLEELDRAAAIKGVPNLAVLRRLFPSLQSRYQVDDAIIEEFPKDESLLGLWVMMSMNRGGQGNDKLAEKAFETFKESYPQLAVIAGFFASRTKSELLKPTVELLGEVKQPSDYLLSITLGMLQPNSPYGQAMGVGALTDGEGEEQQQTRDKLISLVTSWYPKMQSNQRQVYQAVQLFSMIAATLKSKGTDEYLKFLDDEVLRYRASSTKGRNASPFGMAFGGRQQNTLLNPLTFPPFGLTNFPASVLSETITPEMMQSAPQQLQWQMQMAMQTRQMGAANAEEQELTTEAVAKIKDPTLRVLFANMLGNKELIEKELKQLVSAEQPTVDAFLLAAAYAQQNDKSEEALMLLDRGRHLPMSRATRKSFDAAMVGSALAVEKLGDDEKRVAMDAALRLRAAKLNPAERQTLIPALASLGLEKEANKLEEQQAKLVTSGRGGISFGGYGGGYIPQSVSRGRRGANDPITKLLKDGKRDQAIRAVTNQLSAAAANMASNFNFRMMGGGRRNRYVDSRTQSLISRYKLKDDILKSVHPGENSTNVTKLSRYASICLVLNEEDKAREAFEQVLAKRPKDMQTRMQLMMLTDEADKMLEYAKGIDYRSLPMMANAIQQILNSYDMDVEQRLNLVEGIRQHIDGMENLEKTDLTWLVNTTQQLGNHLSNRGGNYYSLYQTNMRRSNRREGAHSELRRKTHDNLCRTLMKHPGTAEKGFTFLLAAHEADQKSKAAKQGSGNAPDDDTEEVSTEDFKELAKSALATAMKSKVRTPNQFGRYYNSGGTQVAFRTPAEYLVRKATQAGDLDYVRDELLPELKKARLAKSVNAVEGYLNLYTCDPAEYVEKAGAYLKKQRPTMPPSDDASRTVVDVWIDRKLDADIGSVVLDSLKPQVKSSMGYAPPGVIIKYATALNDRGGDVNDFLEGVTGLYLGPKGKRTEFVKKNFTPNSVTNGTPNAQIHAFNNLLQQMSQNPALVLPAAMVGAELGMTRNSNMTFQLGQLLIQNNREDVEATARAKKALSNSVFVKDLDEFRAFPEFEGSKTLWGQTLCFMASNGNADAKKELIEDAPKSFGWDLIRACSNEKPRGACMEFFEGYREQIDALPAERKREIGLMAGDLMRQLRNQNSDKGNTTTEATEEWLRGLLGEEKESGFAEKVLKARTIAQITKELQDEEKFRQEMSQLIRLNPTKAKKVFYQLVKILEKGGGRNQGYGGAGAFGGYGGYGGHISMLSFHDSNANLAGSMLQNVIGRHGNGTVEPKSLAFVMDLIATAESEIVMPDDFRYALRNLFQSYQRGNKRVESLKSLYQDFGKELGDTPTSLLAMPLCQIMDSMSQQDRERFVVWAEEQASSGDYPKLAKELLAASKFETARANYNSEMSRRRKALTKEGKPNAPIKDMPTFAREALEYYLEVFADDSLPITWRESVANALLERVPASGNKEVVFASTDLLTKQKKDLMHPPNFVQSTLRRLFVYDKSNDDWKASAKKLTGVWNKLLLRPTGSLARMRQSGNYPYGQEGIVLPLMAMNVELGQTDDFMKLYRAYGQNFSHSNDLLGLMVRYDKSKEAKSLVDIRMQNQYQFNHYSQNLMQYSEELEKRIPAFLETLPLVDERYAIEILLASLQDKPNDANRPRQSTVKDTPRAKRLTALAQRFGQVKFDSDELKEATLGLLLQVHPPSVQDDDTIREEVNKQIASFDIADSMDYRSNLMQKRVPLYRAYAKSALSERKTAELAKMVDEIAAVKTDPYDHGKRQLLESITQPLKESLQKFELRDWQAEDFAPLAKSVRGFLGSKNEQMLNYLHEMPATAVALHSLSGEHEAFEKLFDRKSRNRPGGGRFYLHSLFNYLRGEPTNVSQKEAKAKALPLERRLEIVGSLLRCVAAAEQLQLTPRGKNSDVYLQNSGEMWLRLRDSKLLSDDELIEHAPMLAKVDGGWSLAMVASKYEKQHNQGKKPRKNAEAPTSQTTSGEDKDGSASEKAIEAWQNAISAARDASSEAEFRMALANLFKHLDRKEDAKKVISEQKEVPPNLKRKMDRLLKTLSLISRPGPGATATPLRQPGINLVAQPEHVTLSA